MRILRQRVRVGCGWHTWAAAVVACGLPAVSGFASGPEPLKETLQRTGAVVEGFVEQISGVRCIEQVVQTKLEKKDKVQYKSESRFDSLVLLRLAGDDLKLEESRQLERQTGNAKGRPLLVTSGFSTLELIFHPYYQNSFEFQRLNDQTLGGKPLMQVAFRHIPGTRSPAAIELHGEKYPLDLEGKAWIDPATAAIVRITAEVTGGMEQLHLRTMRSDVQYAPVVFAGVTQPYWLPVTATIDVESPRQHWRNIHHFSEYRRYSVTVKVDLKDKP